MTELQDKKRTSCFRSCILRTWEQAKKKDIHALKGVHNLMIDSPKKMVLHADNLRNINRWRLILESLPKCACSLFACPAIVVPGPVQIWVLSICGYEDTTFLRPSQSCLNSSRGFLWKETSSPSWFLRSAHSSIASLEITSAVKENTVKIWLNCSEI